MADLMRTSNPALNERAFQGERAVLGDTMTLQGTVNKTGVLLICVVATAAWTWNLFLHSHSQRNRDAACAYWRHRWAHRRDGHDFQEGSGAGITAPIYALLEGLVLGSISAMLELRFPGIAIQAVSLTFGTLVVLLLAYRSGLIAVTEKFRLGIIAATGGIALFYIVEIVLGFFGIHFTAINGSGAIGIGFSVFVVIIAALNLVLDFDFIETGVRVGAPKYMEWYGAFGLMVTLIWLYFEILRLLSKIRSRD